VTVHTHYCQRLLLAVRELHVLGYERLRIAPGLNASGTSWRCSLAPAGLMDLTNGALLAREIDGLVARYSSADGGRFFESPRRLTGSRHRLAELIVRLFPAMVRQSRGVDREYARWFLEVVRLGGSGIFPVAYSDWPEEAPNGCLSTSDGKHTRLRVPPPVLPV
jgi:hypothetical protein